MLPDGNGFALAKKIRAQSAVPIIFLTAREKESDRITGFELGADDYVIKPFSPKELALRVNAVLRRTVQAREKADGPGVWTLGEEVLGLDPAGHRALLNGVELDLTGAEWNILRYLAAHQGIVLSRGKILGECLGYSFEGSERTIDTHIKNLRAKLEDPGWIETVRSFGYRFSGTAADARKQR
jgi:two-component system phosphate regulon response regulator PhoB